MFTSLGLSQVISEPTNFDPGKKPSCIDLIVTGQPNIILDSGTCASLDPFCHHQIIYCKANFSNYSQSVVKCLKKLFLIIFIFILIPTIL